MMETDKRQMMFSETSQIQRELERTTKMDPGVKLCLYLERTAITLDGPNQNGENQTGRIQQGTWNLFETWKGS